MKTPAIDTIYDPNLSDGLGCKMWVGGRFRQAFSLGANRAVFLLCKMSPFAVRYERKSEVRAENLGLE